MYWHKQASSTQRQLLCPAAAAAAAKLGEQTPLKMNCCNFKSTGVEPVRVFFPSEKDTTEMTLSKGPVRLTSLLFSLRHSNSSYAAVVALLQPAVSVLSLVGFVCLSRSLSLSLSLSVSLSLTLPPLLFRALSTFLHFSFPRFKFSVFCVGLNCCNCLILLAAAHA